MSETPQDEVKARCKNFVRYLHGLEDSDDGAARAALAALRSGLLSKNGISEPMMRYVVPFLGQHEDSKRDPWFFAIAALFAFHPESGGSGTIGQAFSHLRDESDSIEKRFQQLIASEEEDLFRQLTQTVSLLKAKNIPVNWGRLLIDLTTDQGWNHPDHKLQLKWARDFYQPKHSPAEPTN